MSRAVTRFASSPLPGDLECALRGRFEQAHRHRPFSSVDCRETVHRVRAIVDGLEVPATVYRGGLDLRGVEVDHLWLALRPSDRDEQRRYVIDLAYPLFADQFVTTLRRFVAGEAAEQELAAAAATAGLQERVVGRFPDRLAYLGQPVWSAATR